MKKILLSIVCLLLCVLCIQNSFALPQELIAEQKNNDLLVMQFLDEYTQKNYEQAYSILKNNDNILEYKNFEEEINTTLDKYKEELMILAHAYEREEDYDSAIALLEDNLKFYQNDNQEIDVKNKIAPLKIAIFFTVIIIALIFVSFIGFTPEVKISAYSIISIIGILIGILTGCFNQLKVAVSKPFLFAPEQFEQCFQEMMEEALKPNILQQVFQFITRGSSSIALKRVVIVIDNIDRCNSEQAYNLLTDIKTFLCDEPFNIVFVIPVDDEALRKHILNSTNSSNSDECTRDKEEFLRKFFNVTLRIKPHQPTEMYEFAQKLNDKYALGFKNATINIASKEYAKNPRRVIQLFNNLSAELDNYDTEFATLYETLICKILIIREEYNAYYQELLKRLKAAKNEKSAILDHDTAANLKVLPLEVREEVIKGLYLNEKNIQEQQKRVAKIRQDRYNIREGRKKTKTAFRRRTSRINGTGRAERPACFRCRGGVLCPGRYPGRAQGCCADLSLHHSDLPKYFLYISGKMR